MMLIIAPAGVLTGGLLADWQESRGNQNACPRVLLFAAALTSIISIVALFANSSWMLFSVIGMLQFSTCMAIGIGPATVVKVSPAAFRARISAVYVFMINIVGLGLGQY